MPSLSSILYYIVHAQELRSILQWKVWHDPVHRRDEENEAASLKECFNFLDLTSRSFASVIKELHHELLVPTCLFYLVLRGLDTIEDDMTIPLHTKLPLLRDFHTILDKDGWTFDGNGPNEKDRALLVHFHYVVAEFKKIKPVYQVIIRDITEKMGNGMADYAADPVLNQYGVDTIADYEKYCHYVAGVVGEGLTRLFVESGLANPALLERPDLHESMGQFLQNTNIIRDIREDRDDKRRFWPKEVWSKYVDDFDDLFKKENEEIALRCSSEMVLLALERATDCMYYLAGIKEQSVFNFAAIPQSMAIATLEACFRNPNIFHKNVKITKGSACRLMIDSTQNLKVLYGAFRKYARIIHKKNDPRDPNFLKISVACGKIEQFIETVFPTQDPRAIVAAAGGAVETTTQDEVLTTEEQQKKKEADAEAKRDVLYAAIASFAFMIVISIVMLGIAWIAGARFDLAFGFLAQGKLRPDAEYLSSASAAAAASATAHGEL